MKLALLDRELAEVLLSHRFHLIHRVISRDSTGEFAYYFIYVPPYQEKQFLDALKGNGIVDLGEYGFAVCSNYGDEPSDENLQYLSDIFGFPVPKKAKSISYFQAS